MTDLYIYLWLDVIKVIDISSSRSLKKNIPVTELSLIHGLRIIVICPDKSQGHFVWNPSLSRRENLLCRRGVIPFWLGSYSTVDFDGGDPSLWSHFLGKPKGISKWPHCGGNQTTLKCTLYRELTDPFCHGTCELMMIFLCTVWWDIWGSSRVLGKICAFWGIKFAQRPRAQLNDSRPYVLVPLTASYRRLKRLWHPRSCDLTMGLFGER